MYTNSDTVNRARANESNAEFLRGKAFRQPSLSIQQVKDRAHLASQPPWPWTELWWREGIWRNSEMVP